MVHEFQQSGCLCAAKRTGRPGLWAERFLIHCERHFSSRLPPSCGTWKYAKAPSTKKTWRDSLPIDMLLSAVSVLVVAHSSSEIPEGLMNNPVYAKAQSKSDKALFPYHEGLQPKWPHSPPSQSEGPSAKANTASLCSNPRHESNRFSSQRTTWHIGASPTTSRSIVRKSFNQNDKRVSISLRRVAIYNVRRCKQSRCNNVFVY